MINVLPDRTAALNFGEAGPFTPERRDLLPDWRNILRRESRAWALARAEAAGGPRVLIPTLVGGLAHAGVVESLLAVALTLRGAAVEFLLCDGALGACQLALHGATVSAERLAAGELDRVLCGACHSVGVQTLEGLGLPMHRLSGLLEPSDRRAAEAEAASVPYAEIAGYTRGGLPLGEHALAGTLRFFAVGTLDDEPLAAPVLRRYLAAGRLTARALRRLLAGRRIDRSAFHHGIYVPQGVVRAVLAGAGVPLVTWNPAYRRSCFVFSHGDTYHHTMLDEPVGAWEQLVLDSDDRATLASYLSSRLDGARDWIWYHESPESDLDSFVARSGLDLDRPVVGAFSNVMWDARLHFRSSAYSDQIDWLVDTVAWAGARPEVQLVIRVHPAEIRGTVPSRQRLVDVLRDRIGRLPRNLVLVAPDDPVSSYALAALCAPVLVFGTKAAIEFAAAGLDVVTVGDAWTRGKRVTRDPGGPSEYRKLLLSLPSAAPSASRIERARRYAYHVFLRRMIPLPMFTSTGDDPPLRVAFETLDALRPGRDPGLDVVCDGILHGRPFVYDAQRYGPADGHLLAL
ncbi:MAG: capsule biosynthesis protein [Alphaproteobacteria bacterium]|nr:capsule biosynthesis protein [Alphaproteobacteria bacterium]